MKVLDKDTSTRTQRNFYYDESDDSFVVQTTQDVTDAIEANKAVFNQFDERTPWKGDIHRVASIPMVVYMDLVKKGIAGDDKALARWLDDPDQKVFRTRPGKLSR